MSGPPIGTRDIFGVKGERDGEVCILPFFALALSLFSLIPF